MFPLCLLGAVPRPSHGGLAGTEPPIAGATRQHRRHARYLARCFAQHAVALQADVPRERSPAGPGAGVQASGAILGATKARLSRFMQACRAVLVAKAALSRLWMCSKWTTTWVCFAQGSWTPRRRGCSLPSTTSSFRTKKLFNDPQSASAMRVKRSVDCLLAPAQQGVPVRAKLRAAGPASGVNWILRGRPGEVHQVVIMQTESAGEWGVLWHVPVANEAVASFVTYWQFVLTSQKDQDVLLIPA